MPGFGPAPATRRTMTWRHRQGGADAGCGPTALSATGRAGSRRASAVPRNTVTFPTRTRGREARVEVRVLLMYVSERRPCTSNDRALRRAGVGGAVVTARWRSSRSFAVAVRASISRTASHTHSAHQQVQSASRALLWRARQITSRGSRGARKPAAARYGSCPSCSVCILTLSLMRILHIFTHVESC